MPSISQLISGYCLLMGVLYIIIGVIRQKGSDIYIKTTCYIWLQINRRNNTLMISAIQKK